MKTIEEFLSYLRSLDVKLWADGDRLRYNAPDKTLTSALRAELAERKPEILTFLHKANRVSHSTLPSIQPIPRDTDLPLSFAQQRLWFLDQLEGSSAIYNMSAALHLVGSLQMAALEQSLNEVLRRHEALRTNFATIDERPAQVIAPDLTVTLLVIDLQRLPEVEQFPEVRRLATGEAQRPFDLTKDSLLRVTLLRLGEGSHVLLVTMHHIVSDGWSIGIFIRELETLYEAFLSDQPSPLSELSIQYADFAHWQRQWLQGEVLETQLNYWKQQLAGAPPLLELPTDRPRPPVQTFRGSTEHFQINPDLTRRLKDLSQQSGTTLFMTLLAAYVTLLSRYSGQQDIVVGSPIANRNRSEIESIIGFFVNTLVLRTHLQGNPTFQELLSRVQQVALDAYAHQDVPFELLVEALQPERNLSYTPLFQVMFVLQNAPTVRLELRGLSITPLEISSVTAQFDLTLSMAETEHGLTGEWEYNTDLFDAATITRMLGHFQTLLEAIVANPQQLVSELSLLTETERHQLLVEWNDTFADYPQNKCIHQLFEAQVERTPDAVAVVFEDEQLTYHELNCRANQLAHHLQGLGIEPEVLVGICVERSLEMIVGLLGILKAGGAYVPLDPEYPQERLSFMLEDAQVPVLLTQQQLLEKLPQHQAQIVCLDTDWQFISQLSQDNALAQLPVGIAFGGATSVADVQATNLAYVIYTSGSTGKPKGVMIPHGAIANHCCIIQQAYALVESDRVLQFASINFDVSLEEIFPTLIAGATLVLRGSDVWTPRNFQKIISHFRLTVVNLPTAYWQQLAQEWAKTQVLDTNSQLRLVIVGGDVMLPKYVAIWQQSAMFRVRLVNAYGPTETTITATLFEIIPQLSEGINLKKMPIGRPLPNRTVYILDSYLQPVPIGVPGELYIGGGCLAKGYLNRPELTQEKFIPNPFSDVTERLYKTGDLARYLSNGNIEYLGRIDNQVKIRGFRIELGEIEAVLAQHPDVEVTVVIAQEDYLGDKRLVAYVVPNHEQAPTPSELRRFLKEKLPDYMVPFAFVMLEALPVTPNGKVDCSALPAPEISQRSLEEGFVAPHTPTEEVLAAIWAEVLGVERVGIHDNFFELGGDSILSIQLIARANQAGLQLTPRQLFLHQTIAELAALAGTRTLPVQSEQGLVMGSVPLTPIQQWFFEQNLPYPDHFNQSVLLEVPPDLKPELLKQVMQQLLVHHDALRLRFVQDESIWQQINVGLEETVSLTVVDFSQLSSGEQQTALEATAAELQASLHLSEGSLMRVALFNFGIDKPARLLLVIHHLAVDGVSWRILLEDLSTAYHQLSRGEAIQLQPKTTSFKDWAYRLREYGQSETLAADLDYWLAQARSKVAPLPVDYPSGKEANIVASAAHVSVSLSVEQTRALLQEVPSAYNTQINDVLLTALGQTFAKWTGERFLLVDLEGHGREDLFEDVELSRTVGWFTTIFPVLLELGEVSYPGDGLKSVKEQLRRIPNRGIGYGLLRYLSRDAATRLKLQALPQAEVSFNYLGQLDQVLSESPLWGLAKESSGPDHSQIGSRSHLLEVKGFVAEGKLQLDWTYSENVHQRTTVERLAQRFMEALQFLIAHCQSPQVGGYTSSDFPEAELSQEELEELLAQLSVSEK
jgi:amino acid adenylation domain-containing protein/non-ribosomal peptide synthase protein (TIGR01720 family)